MYRFTIRELVCVTLAVGAALGWWSNERAHQAQIRRIEADTKFASRWRDSAEAMTRILEDEGWQIEWDLNRVRFDARWKIENARPQPYMASYGPSDF